MIAEDDDEASKTEEPSERKISKAKEEGDIAISQDAKSFIMLLGMLFVIWLVLPRMFKWFYMFSLKFVENPDAIPTDGRHIRLLLYNTVIALMKILGIPFAIFMVLGIFASVAQTGFVYAPKKLEPNWNKLNIFAAMTQFINMKKNRRELKRHHQNYRHRIYRRSRHPPLSGKGQPDAGHGNHGNFIFYS